MTYFSRMPLLQYDFTTRTDAQDQIDVVQDLMVRSRLYIRDEDKDLLTMPYRVIEGERPDVIAFKLYNDPQLHWTVLFANNIADIYSEWPMTSQELKLYCIERYGADKVQDIHHYEKIPEMVEMELGWLVTHGYQYQSYTNLEYEIRENELKSYIKVIRPELMAQFVDLYNSSIVR